MTTDFSIRLNCLPCPHRRVVSATSGGLHFSQGDVWDDVEEELLCLDCMEILTEAEVRDRWEGHDPRPVPGCEEGDDVPF